MSDPVRANYDHLDYIELLFSIKCPYQLTLSIEELTKPAAKIRGDAEQPPRPQNSWIIFRRDYEARLRLFNQHAKQKVKETAKECSSKWRTLSSEDKYFFKILEKMAYENHKSLYPNYKYKPKNIKGLNAKKWVFREQKKYTFTSVPMSNNSSPQEATQIVRSSSHNHTAITTSISIDNAHPPTINDNNKAGNSIDDAFNKSLDQLPFSSGNNDEYTAITTSTTIDNAHLSTINANNKSLDQLPFSPGNDDESFIISNTSNTNNLITPISLPTLESQPLFIAEYDLSNTNFEDLLHEYFS